MITYRRAANKPRRQPGSSPNFAPMAEADQLLGMYLHLARASSLRGQPMVHVKLLVLAGVQAEEMGLAEISALCRHRILGHNSRHLVRRWPTLGEALATENFQGYLKQLRRRYSSEKIEHMMHSLGIEMGRERAAYFSDAEYAAALLDTRPDAIAEILARPPAPPGPRRPQRRAAAAATAARPARPVAPPARNLLVVWAPVAAGLVGLAVWAIAARALGL
jgi:hypothetical protein